MFCLSNTLVKPNGAEMGKPVRMDNMQVQSITAEMGGKKKKKENEIISIDSEPFQKTLLRSLKKTIFMESGLRKKDSILENINTYVLKRFVLIY